MPTTLFCWRCQMDIPMLSDSEFEIVSPYLSNALEQIKLYREQHGCSLAEAQSKGYGQRALEIYEQMTGFKETNPTALFHHRLSMFGPPCLVCGKPLRTPHADFCATCGARSG